jgi:hypothetical protein
MPYEPALGDVVGIETGELVTVGEVVELPGGSTVGVRVTEDGHGLYGQKVYFNAGQLTPVQFRRVQ